MDIRLNIYDENNRWVGADYLTEKGKWMHKWVHKGELERGSWHGRAVGENDINWRYESALAEPSSVPQANELLPHVSGSLHIDFAVYLTGHDKETIEQMYNDWRQ